MEIKTIVIRLDNAETFDKEVNNALADGWELLRRDVLQPLAQSDERYTYIMLYAELVRFPIAEEVTAESTQEGA